MALNPENDETLAMGVTTPRPASAGDKQRFTPGELVARRYRIVSRLGKGGMGEVFRAEDIVLGQPVALKFLPESAGNNSGLLTRFYDEVRIARQISHSNVCRVYDIGDIDGHPYLSMEYIDGEDLSSLLRRIGRLPGDKAAEFARKICAGVAAAHAQGVLHRDIKPGNIMIDGRGEPRITDFGLAAVATGIEGTEIRNGTPAYMAPEQLEGREVSVQSDLYALGLVFHEMFTGKVAHDADTIAELTKIRRDATVTRTSSLVADLDPAVDRAIQACLQPDPKLRPKSALDVARMLPGGDPLAAALAAGQTPSPEMVAAAGPSEVLAPKRALAVLGMLAVGLIAMAFTTESSSEHTPILRMAAPEVLADRARTILHSAGYSEPPVDSAWGLTRDPDFVSYMEKHVRQREQWYDILPKHPSNLKFWYRESPRGFNPSLNTNGVVSPIDPAMSIGGMTRVETGLNGELIQFTAVPPQTVKADAGSAASVEWADFFEMAKLDMTKFQPAAPEWTPLVVTDARVAWTGLQPVNYKQPIEIPLRVEAASFAGRPVYFQVIYPWTESPRNAQARQRSAAETWTARVILGLYLLFTAAAAWMALHHWRTGRGDRKGALRVAIAVGILNLIVKMLQAHHSSIDFELQFLGETIADSLFYAGLYWMFYLVMEPWVRRYWPQCLVTWTRIVQGRWRDPLVGRDALFAVTAGTVLVLSLFGMGRWIARYEQIAPVGNFAVENLEGTSFALARLVAMAQSGVSSILAFLLGMFFLRAILRKAWLAGGVFVVLGALLQMTNGRNPSVLVFLMWSIMFAIIAWVMLRWGMFAGIILIFTVNTQALNMLTTNYGAWYGTSSWISLAALAAIGLWGYRTATAGRSLLEEAPAP